MFGLRRLSRARQAFESRTEVWREVGLGAEIDRRQVTRAKGAVLIELALIAAVLLLFEHRRDLFPGLGEPVRIATVAMLVGARFEADTTPAEVEERLAEAIDVPIRYAPHIAVEELDHDEVVVKIVVTPERPADGGRLAGEVLSAVRETDGAQRRED